ncbi:hypothetical protein DMB95_01850 [Campylobacter sp. MIT 12-8780]|uniref:ion transporter n=1 Tax=unclassified Campylobacter TaxID=2593542 RepID=UPI00115CC16F|nr:MULTISPECIES: ion transporter [unclassified Campylobacter]NDJ26797.1 ion transporter [Campylobacter sp. MIT 19-121]TQR42382.1 hypothetical protein DMB95_01850 [Campylobacter sp. MIT 12-8780]
MLKLLHKFENFINSKFTNYLISSVVLFNAIILGLMTETNLKQNTILHNLNNLCLWFFCIEMLAKIVALRLSFFKSKLNIFDLIVIAISASPILGDLSILRFLRVFILFRLFSTLPQVNFIVSVMLRSLPSVACTGVVLLFVLYVYGVLCVEFFGVDFPQYFGNLGRSFYTLFQIMTLEGWSENIVRPILELYPYAWILFVSFILVASFVILNIVVGIIIDTINELKDKEYAKAGKIMIK